MHNYRGYMYLLFLIKRFEFLLEFISVGAEANYKLGNHKETVEWCEEGLRVRIHLTVTVVAR